MAERLDSFMARANAVFYANADPFASFTTAPEISQAFGEVLGAWAAIVWEQMGSPTPVLLAELGPGRGTLMADALRVAALRPEFRAALRVHFVETSPRLRAAQAARVPDATWHDRAEALPSGPTILFANEFLDALPIRQFVEHDGMRSERLVSDGALVPPVPERGVVWEVCEPALELASWLAARLAAHGGVALFLDYGPERSGPGNSLQALRDGEVVDPVATEPGTADLTAHVDFEAFARAASAAGAASYGPVPQGPFLARLGLFRRTDRLARGQPPRRALELVDAARRLAEPDRMGRLFKALAISDPRLPEPPGFSP